MIATRNQKLMVTLTALALLVALPAWAHGRPGLGAGKPGGERPPFAGGVLGQLIFPCPAACAETVDSCVATADAAAVDCVSSACPTEVTTAQTACAEVRSSEECRDAVAALRDCGETCLDTRSTAIQACRAALSDCRDACESAE